MTDQTEESTIDNRTFRDKHSFLLFITISILISCFVVFVSMTLYNGSGAAQLDLSRPGYVSVRSQAVTNDGDFKDYPSTGGISKDVINDFISLYTKQAQKVKAVDAFGGSPLDPDGLGIGALPSVTNR